MLGRPWHSTGPGPHPGLTCAGPATRSSARAGPIPGSGRSAAPGQWRRWRGTRSRAGRSVQHPSSSPRSGRLGSSWPCPRSGATLSGTSLGNMKDGGELSPKLASSLQNAIVHAASKQLRNHPRRGKLRLNRGALPPRP